METNRLGHGSNSIGLGWVRLGGFGLAWVAMGWAGITGIIQIILDHDSRLITPMTVRPHTPMHYTAGTSTLPKSATLHRQMWPRKPHANWSHIHCNCKHRQHRHTLRTYSLLRGHHMGRQTVQRQPVCVNASPN